MNRSGLSFLCIVIATAPAAAVAQTQLSCRPNVVSCNFAEHFSGTLSWTDSLTVNNGRNPGGIISVYRDTVSVIVVRGVATCKGRLGEHRETWSNNILEQKSDKAGTISGPGVLAIEEGKGTDNDPDEFYYRIAIACPRPGGEIITVSYVPPLPPSRLPLTPEPARLSSDHIETYNVPGRVNVATLNGRYTYEHPETDAANDVTGSVTFTWALTRGAPPAPRPPLDRQSTRRPRS